MSRAPLLLLLLPLLAACARLGVPAPAIPGSGSKGVRELVENRVWIDESPEAAAGTLRAFLSDGTLIMTSCTETYRLAPWRWVEGSTLVWEEDGSVLRAEVAIVERDTLALVVELAGGEELEQRFHAAKAPIVCPDLPR